MSIIAAGTTTTTALSSTGNTDGTLQFQVNGTTPSVTLNTLGAVGVGSSPNYGTSGQVLISGGSTTAPTWGTAGTATSATTATNLAGGSAGTVPYQSASGTTAMLAAGSSGQVLTSSGAGAPTWTTPSSFGVTSIGSVVRKSGAQLFLATATNSIATSGYVPASGLHMSGQYTMDLAYPRYSTYYSAWFTHDTTYNSCYMSKDGINWTPVFTRPSDYGNSGTPGDGASQYVVDDSNGYIYCFGAESGSSTLVYWYKTDPTAAWSAYSTVLASSTNRNYWSVDFVWFGSAATSGFVIAYSSSSNSYVGVIAAGGTSFVSKINTTNNNGQSMSMDWNQTGGTVVVMNRSAGSTSQYSVMYKAGSDVNGSWTGVTRASCGFDPGTNTYLYKPAVGPSGAVMWSSFTAGSYYYAAAGSLGSTWSSTTVGSNKVMYLGHNGTSWYMAKGQDGTLSTNAGYLSGFYTSSSATPSSLSSSTAFPFLPLDTANTTYLSGVWTQRKY